MCKSSALQKSPIFFLLLFREFSAAHFVSILPFSALVVFVFAQKIELVLYLYNLYKEDSGSRSQCLAAHKTSNSS